MIPSRGAKISNTRHHGQKKCIKLKEKKAPSSETVAEIAKPWLSFPRWETQACGNCLTS